MLTSKPAASSCHVFFGAFRSNRGDDSAARIRRALDTPPLGYDVAEDHVHESDHLVVAASQWSQPDGCDSAALALTGCPLWSDDATGGPTSLARDAERDGSAALGNVDGSFAAAFVDAEAGFLIGDRFGQQQLFYTYQANRLWFGTDLRLLLAVAEQRRVRTLGLLEWIYHANPLEPGTFFEEFRSLPGGCALRFDATCGHVRVERVFEPIDAVSSDLASELAGCSAAELERRLERTLEAAVAKSVAGEPAVSILLSGGVDSGLLTAMAAKHTKVEPIHVEVKEMSEQRHAAAVARHLGLDLESIVFGRSEFRSSVCDTVYATCSPVILNFYVSLQHLANHGFFPAGQRIIDGVGADALFTGAARSSRLAMVTHLLSRLTRIPSPRLGRWGERAASWLARGGIRASPSGSIDGLHRLLWARGIERVLLLDRIDERLSHLPEGPERSMAVHMLDQFYDQGLMFQGLRSISRTAGSDLLLPFLDLDAVRLSVNLPVATKVRWDWRQRRPATKWLEKRIAARWIPPRAVRPKVGFGMPGGTWIGELPSAWLRDSWISEQFSIPRSTLEQLIARCGDSQDRVFLFTTEIWGRLFARGQSLESVRREWLEGAS